MCKLFCDAVTGSNEFSHRFHMELLLQGVEFVQTGIDGIQSVGIEFHVIYTTADFLCDVLQFDIAALHSASHISHAWIDITYIFQLMSGILQFVKYAVVVSRKRIVCFEESGLDVLRMAQGLCFLLQLFQFAFL